MTYAHLTDEELVGRFQDGDSSVVDYLLEKYKNLVKGKAKSMYILGADKDDLIQEGMIGLFKAIRDYDFGRDTLFYTFADLCVSRQMYSAVRSSNCKKHYFLNTYISLDGSSVGEENEAYGGGVSLGNAVSVGENNNPEEIFLNKESEIFLEKKIEEELSDFEKQVLDLYLTGMSYSQIAKVLGRDEKSTDNALQRVKTKIRKILKR
jgi:RNA polymerase sporulation-specific sigma factor